MQAVFLLFTFSKWTLETYSMIYVQPYKAICSGNRVLFLSLSLSRRSHFTLISSSHSFTLLLVSWPRSLSFYHHPPEVLNLLFTLCFYKLTCHLPPFSQQSYLLPILLSSVLSYFLLNIRCFSVQSLRVNFAFHIKTWISWVLTLFLWLTWNLCTSLTLIGFLFFFQISFIKFGFGAVWTYCQALPDTGPHTSLTM